MKAGITIAEGVSAGRGAEAARLLAKHAVWATVDWPLEQDEGDRTISASVVYALSSALTSCGYVVFRYDEPLDGAVVYLRPPSRTLVSWLRYKAGFGETSFGVVEATDHHVIAALFEFGWTYALQTALVFEPNADRANIFNALRCGLNWRDRPLPGGARLLFGPGHDGGISYSGSGRSISLSILSRRRTKLSAIRPPRLPMAFSG